MKYKVSLYTCPAHFPFFFAVHSWFVVEVDGEASRWELTFRKSNSENAWGHIKKDQLPATSGIEVFPLVKGIYWPVTLRHSFAGEEGSEVQRLAEFILSSGEKYPNKDRYVLTGPNSNTYIEWIINEFPKLGFELPWNAIGK